jgi:dTDP-4-amino-4,6-dideoxygalactose transaminase
LGEIVDDAVREIAKPGALHDEREIDAVLEVLRTSTLDLGPKIEEMEQRTAELLAKRHGVSTCCTCNRATRSSRRC